MAAMRLSIVTCLLLAGCPKKAPPVPSIDPPAADAADWVPAKVTTGDQLAAVDGKRAILEGVLKRAVPAEGSEEGTAILLDDRTLVFVAFGAPPDGWDWLVGSSIRVQGTVHTTPPDSMHTRHTVPVLTEYDTPMPGKMAPSLELPDASDLLK